MIDYALEILQAIKKGEKLKHILLAEKDKERLTMQIMMEGYLKTF